MATSSRPKPLNADSSYSYFAMSPGPRGGRAVDTSAIHGCMSNRARFCSAMAVSRDRQDCLSTGRRSMRRYTASSMRSTSSALPGT